MVPLMKAHFHFSARITRCGSRKEHKAGSELLDQLFTFTDAGTRFCVVPDLLAQSTVAESLSSEANFYAL